MNVEWWGGEQSSPLGEYKSTPHDAEYNSAVPERLRRYFLLTTD